MAGEATMITSFRYMLALLKMSLKSSVSLRGAFLTKMIFMAANNLLFMVIWLFFFQHFETLRGWDIKYMALMFGLVAASFGLWVIFANGLRMLAKMIDDGDLDTLLLQPKPVLLNIAGAQSEASGFGEVLTGLVLFALSGFLQPHLIPWLLVVLFLGFLFWCSLSILLGSLAFWFKDMNEWARELLMSALFFATWPNSIYSGTVKIVIFTIIPVGFLSYMPVQFLTGMDWVALAISCVGISAMLLCSLLVFHLGLNRYESGNRFGVRG